MRLSDLKYQTGLKNLIIFEIYFWISFRLCDKLLEPLSPIRESAALALSILAELADGKEAIVQNDSIIENLLLCLGDQQTAVRLKAAACFRNVATSWISL